MLGRGLRRQGERLADLIEAHWPGSKSVLDVSCGIGMQAIGLALQGCAVTAFDLPAKEVTRAAQDVSRGWDFDGDSGDGDHCELSLFVVVENLASGSVETHVMRSRYHAVSTQRLCELMREAGLDDVKRLDGVFYQPVLIGTRSA